MKNIQYVGCDDAELDLFESQYALPDGMCYNSYVVLGEKQVAVMDGVDARCAHEWLDKVEEAMDGRTPDYLVCQHMEPDHSGAMALFLEKYPQAQVLCSKQAVVMMQQFGIEAKNVQIVAEGQRIDLGGVTLQFIAAPMIHWPEVMMTYCAEEQVLFSADAFGKFGVYHADEDDWACEARRYYFNIVGKYGVQAANVLKKLAGKDIQTIAPLHGPMLEGEKKDEALRLYHIWSAYGVETKVCWWLTPPPTAIRRRPRNNSQRYSRRKGQGRLLLPTSAVTTWRRRLRMRSVWINWRFAALPSMATSFRRCICSAINSASRVIRTGVSHS